MTDVADLAAGPGSVVGPVGPSADKVRLRPIPLSAVRLGPDGWWGQWQTRNREISLPYGIATLERAGNLDNFRRILGRSDAAYRGFVFNDTDLYKTLEAVAWTLAQFPDPQLRAYVDIAAELIGQAQDADGYVNTYVQGTPGLRRYSNLLESHELYSAGHLIQAGVADFRATGEHRLLDVAQRFADLLVAEFGAGARGDFDGHAEVETALVELYRVTGNVDYLRLAAQLIDSRGRGVFGEHRLGLAYFQDETPVREAKSIVGHSVRALYLEAGVVDVAVETSDDELLQSSLIRWQDMVSTKLYITGGVGSRHKSEGFGDPYELPPDRAYCETCAAVASIHWNWRLLLATGESRFADLLERTLYNGFGASTGLDGTSFFYSNPLHVREDHAAGDEEESGHRLPWYACACCPPNIMRMVASLHDYLATTDANGIQIHQFTDATLDLGGDHSVVLETRTGYPWIGDVEITVSATTDSAWCLSLRVPGWATGARAGVNGGPPVTADGPGYLRIERSWVAGDTVRLEFEMPVRLTVADPRVDAVRGCVAVERGPLVYCAEAADNPGLDLAQIQLDTSVALGVTEIAEWPGVKAVRARGLSRASPHSEEALYHGLAPGERSETPIDFTLIPYYLWGNRTSGPMRVWLPRAD
jgi:uncharacterized protein